jgi:hypothetical protein
MVCDEDCRTAVLGKTERTVGWEGDGDPIMTGLVRHCKGKLAATDRSRLPSLSHSFTLDCNIYVRSRQAGERVMASVSRFLIRKLRLTVNAAKSAVARPAERSFLGFRLANDGSLRSIAPQALTRFKQRVRDLTRRTRGVSLPKLMES